MQPFNDLVLSNWNWEDFKIEHTIKDLKNRTDVLKTEADSLEKIINTHITTTSDGNQFLFVKKSKRRMYQYKNIEKFD
mgnify:CR=1 FL=1